MTKGSFVTTFGAKYSYLMAINRSSIYTSLGVGYQYQTGARLSMNLTWFSDVFLGRGGKNNKVLIGHKCPNQ